MSAGYDEEVGVREAIVVFLDTIKPITNSLNSMLDDKELEGCVALENVLRIGNEVSKFVRWYMED